ncbi:MAG: NAD(P)H-binding protein [Armatimonadota bacterium]
MPDSELIAITGAFGYSGRHIARRLLAMDKRVITLTGHPRTDSEFGNRIAAYPLDFSKPAELTESLKGVTTLVNTYWIRFSYGDMTFDKAVENSKRLINAAKDAGVERIVHVSITNPSKISPLPYYSGKARVEKAITESGLSYAILRPNVLFGDEGILINNIAWMLRHFPIFTVPGSGEYQIQPIYVEDLAELVVRNIEPGENVVFDAVGPEIYTFIDLVRLIANKTGRSARLIHLPPYVALFMSRIVGKFLGDVVLTRDEVDGLHMNLLVSSQPPTGWTKLSEWLEDNSDWIGTRYMSELKKHYL